MTTKFKVVTHCAECAPGAGFARASGCRKGGGMSSRKRPKRKAKRLWDGNASDLDLYYAGLDPRQLHFSFYLAESSSIEGRPDEQRQTSIRKTPHRRWRRAACQTKN
jgi:hypothetical protein